MLELASVAARYIADNKAEMKDSSGERFPGNIQLAQSSTSRPDCCGNKNYVKENTERNLGVDHFLRKNRL